MEVGLDRENAASGRQSLSGGQKQRVALARALVGTDSKVLAFDEPLGGAPGAYAGFHVERLLERVWRDQGFTAILVTQDVSEAVALADRVLIMDEGRIAHDIDVELRRCPGRTRLCRAWQGGRVLSFANSSRAGANAAHCLMRLPCNRLHHRFRTCRTADVIIAGRCGDRSGQSA